MTLQGCSHISPSHQSSLTLRHLVRVCHSPCQMTLCHQSGQPTRPKWLPHFTGNGHNPKLTPPQITAVCQKRAQGTYSEGNRGRCWAGLGEESGRKMRCWHQRGSKGWGPCICVKSITCRWLCKIVWKSEFSVSKATALGLQKGASICVLRNNLSLALLAFLRML